MKKAIKILFLCHGNICRSPGALYIMKKLTADAGLADRFFLDSAATTAEEIGNPVYPPMARVLEAHGVPCSGHAARQMTRRDYEDFDLLICMDRENLRDLARFYHGDPEGKVHLLMEYAGRPGTQVSDPWWTRDFEEAYRDLLEGCRGLLEALRPDL